MAEQVKSHQSCASDEGSAGLDRTGKALVQSGEETIDSGDENIPMLVDAYDSTDESADEMHIKDSRPGDRGCKMSDKVTLPSRKLSSVVVSFPGNSGHSIYSFSSWKTVLLQKMQKTGNNLDYVQNKLKNLKLID